MSMLSVDVEKRLGDFFLAARFETVGGVTALFGASFRHIKAAGGKGGVSVSFLGASPWLRDKRVH